MIGAGKEQTCFLCGEDALRVVVTRTGHIGFQCLRCLSQGFLNTPRGAEAAESLQELMRSGYMEGHLMRIAPYSTNPKES